MSLGRHSLRGGKTAIYKIALELIQDEFNRAIKELKYMNDTTNYLSKLDGNISDFNRTTSISPFIKKESLFSFSSHVRESFFHSTIQKLKILEKSDLNSYNLTDVSGNWEPGIYLIKVDDSLETLKMFKGQADIIATDPPYGFNTSEGGALKLLDFFGSLPENLLNAMAPKGQLTVVLPAFSKNGKVIHYTETCGFFTRQILAKAQSNDRTIVSYANTLPEPRGLFEPPYYWASHTTLERRIVTFTVE